MNLLGIEAVENLSEILATLNEEEFKMLKKMLPGWQQRKRKKVIDILNTINSNLNKPIELRLKKVTKLFEVKTEKSVSNYINIVIKEVELFIIRLETEKNTILRTDILMNFAQKQNSSPMFNKNKVKMMKSLSNTPNKLSKSFQLFKTSHQIYNHTFTNKFDAKNEELLRQSNLHLNDFYLIAQLQLACEIQSRAKAVGNTIDFMITPYYLNLAHTRSSENNIINIYYEVYLMLSGKKTIPIEDVIPFYKKSIQVINPKIQLELLILLINYTNTFINKTGERKYKLIAHELHQLRMEDQLFRSHPTIEKQFFISIVQLAMALSKDKTRLEKDYLIWAKSFIDKYQDYITNQHKDETIYFCNGILAMYTKDLEQAFFQFKALHQQTKATVTKLQALTYQSIILVEKDFLTKKKSLWYVDDLKYLCRKIKVLTNEPNNGEEVNLMYKKFADYLRRIITLRNIDYKILKQEVQKEKFIASKNWLLHVIKEIS